MRRKNRKAIDSYGFMMLLATRVGHLLAAMHFYHKTKTGKS